MPATIDLTGQRYGRLTVQKFIGKQSRRDGQPKAYWSCLCACGRVSEVASGNLRSGSVKSCGCLRAEVLDKTTHGLSGGKHYTVWDKMVRRCHDPEEPSYPRYGGRGVSVCDRWRDLANFIADMGPRPHGMTLDRIDNDGNYEPGNCRWAAIVQQQNNKRNNFRVSFRGRTQTISEWAREIGINHCTLHSRLVKLGWSTEKALTTPRANRGKQRPI